MFVVVTDRSGASRVYESKDIKYIDWDQKDTVTDSKEKMDFIGSRLQSPRVMTFPLTRPTKLLVRVVFCILNTRLVH